MEIRFNRIKNSDITLDSEMLTDPDISFAAKGLLTCLQGDPTKKADRYGNWSIRTTAQEISHYSNDSLDTIEITLQELETSGYILTLAQL